MEENTVPFLYLAEMLRDEDERQDAIVLFLEQQPTTEIAAQAIINRLHHSKRHEARKQPSQLSYEPSDNPSATLGIHEAISRLPEADRELVTLRYVNGLTVSAISIRVGVDYKTTHTALTRAVEKLRIILQISP